MNRHWKGCGKKRPWHVLNYCLSVFMEALRNPLETYEDDQCLSRIWITSCRIVTLALYRRWQRVSPQLIVPTISVTKYYADTLQAFIMSTRTIACSSYLTYFPLSLVILREAENLNLFDLNTYYVHRPLSRCKSQNPAGLHSVSYGCLFRLSAASIVYGQYYVALTNPWGQQQPHT
jgi:hypothetical protein